MCEAWSRFRFLRVYFLLKQHGSTRAEGMGMESLDMHGRGADASFHVRVMRGTVLLPDVLTLHKEYACNVE
jgi:hypothetical protein